MWKWEKCGSEVAIGAKFEATNVILFRAKALIKHIVLNFYDFFSHIVWNFKMLYGLHLAQAIFAVSDAFYLEQTQKPAVHVRVWSPPRVAFQLDSC
jgi:hypothetical protein